MRSCSRIERLGFAAAASVFLAASAPAQAWGTAASFPTVMVRATGVWFPPTARFYVLGGRTSDSAGSDLQSVFEYAPGTNSWALKLGALPTNQNNNMVGGVLVQGGTSYIYVVGGSAAAATTSTADVRRYDPVADVVTTIASDPWSGPPVNTLPGGAAVFGNKLYVLGGFTIGVGMTTQIWQFDPNAAAGTKWTLKAASLPVALGYVPAATIGGTIYAAGGSTFSGGLLYDSNGTYAYDPVLDTLSATTLIPRVTAETRAVNANGQLWVLGGGRTAPNPSNQVDSFDPNSSLWSLAPSFVDARRNIAADVDPATGNVYMVGGYTTAGVATDSMEIYSACGLSVSYCTAGTTSHGCIPAISGSGTPSASAGSGFTISVANVEGQKSGLVFYSVSGPNAVQWGTGSNSFLCVKTPTQRTLAQNSGGTANLCDGALALDWNAFIAANPSALGQPFAGGDVVWAQGWFRDPTAVKTTNLTDGLQFNVCP